MTIPSNFELANDSEFRLLANFTAPPRAGRITAIEPSGQVRVATDDADGGDVLAWPLNGFHYAVNDVVYITFAANSPDTAIVLGAKAPLPVLDASVLGLSGDWDIGEDRRIQLEALRARDGEGIAIETDDGFVVILVKDDGQIDIRRSGSDGPMMTFNTLTIVESGLTFVCGFQVQNSDADDVSLTIIRDTATNAMMGAGVGGDTVRRIVIQADGKILWGDGSNARDTNLYRVTERVLKSDGSLSLDQSSTTGNRPVLYLDQADLGEEFIEFITTIGTGNPVEAVGAKVLTTTHFIKVKLPGGLIRYLPVGTIA
jgi:hypothetical protein